MADTKVKISHILDNQIPDFIHDENPLFKEFLNQYYISQEHEYGNIDIAENITDVKNISNFIDLNIVGYQSLVPIQLTEEITSFDEIINVSNTLGFPNSYGIFKIDNEIITYTGKTATSFTGCVRGFSAISALEKNGDPQFLTFSSTESDDHDSGAVISNLSHIFLLKFYEKFKANYLPGVENRNFMTGLSVENILSRAKDFYTSKGTDTALDILFQVLFGKSVTILKPFDDTITSSDAEWIVADQLMVEALEGDPVNLKQTVIFQESFTSPTATGAVSNVEEIFLGSKKYHRISLSKGSMEGTFNVNNKTQVVGSASTSSVITVDSTVGFTTTNGLLYLNSSGSYTPITYQSKSDNQFFDTNATVTLSEGTPIIDNVFIFGYENNDTTKVCKMRVMGAISNVSNNFENTKFFREQDDIKLKYLGEKTDVNDKKFNTWFYNNVSYLEIVQPTTQTNTIETLDKHFLHKGDRIDILDRETKNVIISNVEITSTVSDTQFSYVGTGVTSSMGILSIKKRLSFASANLGLDFLISNIQNTFLDKEKNTYVAFSGYPSDNTIESTDRSVTFKSNDVSNNTINIPAHQFLNGEKVYYQPQSTNSGITGIGSGTYFVKVIDVDNIKLSLNGQSLYSNNTVSIVGSNSTDEHKITPSIPVSGAITKLQNQNNFRRILKNPKNNQDNQNIVGPIGLSLNGIEYHSPISNDTVFYGQIDDIIVLDKGNGYSVATPPNISIVDSFGSSAVANAHIDEGQIKEIVLTNKGFDYLGTPSVTISGGNGRGAQAQIRMEGFKHSVSFNDFKIDLTDNKITLDEEHKFLNGEEVVYTAGGTPIGVGATNIGFSTSLLSSGGNYFISHFPGDKKAFKIHMSKENAIAGINTIDFLAFGNDTHTFTAKNDRSRVAEIAVIDGGNGYQNNKVVVSSTKYPPQNQEDIFKTFVGISTFDNCIYAKNHNFKNNDLIKYTTSNTAIGGLSNSTNYIVTVVNDHKFKLSTNKTDYNNKVYINLTTLGSGSHTFNYPDISVTISGPTGFGSTSAPSYYTATAEPVVNGKICNIFMESGGVGYGVTNIVNFIRSPKINVETGKNAELIPVINSRGEINDVVIVDGGNNYSSAPEIVITGDGKFAKMRSTVSGGSIVSIEILNIGKGYSSIPGKTTITAVPFGSGCILGSELHRWQLNNVERYDWLLTGTNKLRYKDTVQIKSETRIKGNKICSFYPPKEIRKILNDNLDINTLQELNPGDAGSGHSKILGWAYDGNPIYGSIGNAKAIPDSSGAGGLKRLKSSYELVNPQINSGLRPSGFSQGKLIDDYVYKGTGDLDEHNGRFIVNQDFPNGTYAYFATVDSTTKLPTFPYITFKHKDATDSFNYNIFNTQDDETLNSGLYKRNITPLGIKEKFRNYPFLGTSVDSKVVLKIDSIAKSGITTVKVLESGENYKVNELINFQSGVASAKIKDVLGKTVISVGTTEVTETNLKFAFENKKVTAFSTVPHNYKDFDLVEISGISSSVYKNIEGFRTVGVVTSKTSLTVGMGNTIATGINTFISLQEPTVSKKFKSDDIIKIGNEEMLITMVDDLNNRYNVVRKRNNVETSHNANSEVNKLPQEFTFNYEQKLENKNIEPKQVEFFDASFITIDGINYNRSVGVGSTSNNIVTGFTSTATINSSIPNSIFLPGHKFKTGDKLKVTSFDGGIVKSSLDASISNPFDLSTIEPLICVKFNNDFIGLSTTNIVGFSTDLIFFSDQSTGSNHKIEKITDDVIGKAIKTAATLIVDDQHLLVEGDDFNLNISPNNTQEFLFKFNQVANRLVADPVLFLPSAVGVGSTVSTITIPDHNFKTGDPVIYIGSNSADLLDPLVNNNVYHVIRIDKNTIRLANNSYESNAFPYKYIKFTDNGAGDHELSKINPRIEIQKGNTVSIGVSHPSLSGYSLRFYNDREFKSKFNYIGITTAGSFGDSNVDTKILITNTENLPKELFYRIEGLDVNYTNTFPSSIYSDTDTLSKISFVESKFNGKHRVTGVGSTTISFTLAGNAEKTSYDSTGFSTAFYSSNSTNIQGGINSIEIIDKGNLLSDLPVISSIGSTTGINGRLSVESEDIGKIRAVTVSDQGLEFTNNKTLTPRADSYTILKLKNTSTLEGIGIKTGGQDYTTPPTVIAIGQPNISTKVELVSGSVEKVKIVTNDSGFDKSLRIIPTVNSNGVGVINAVSQVVTGSQTNILSLRAPIVGFSEFPFAVGDEIFVENVKNLNGDGYNSSDYGFKTFIVSGINTISGTESVSYSIVGLGSTGGIYDSNNDFGRVIKKDDLVSLEPQFKQVKFLEGETITQGNASGRVVKDGWDENSQLLKLENVVGTFTEEQEIVGSVDGTKSTIENIFDFDFDLEVSGSVNKSIDWENDKGKLSVNTQRLHDNDYYQRFSYSVKGEVPYQSWKEPVNSLAHVSGYKNFSDYQLINQDRVGLTTLPSTIKLSLNVETEASVHRISQYDLATEDTNSASLSKIISFESAIITDYNESVTNKVLLIDDISTQFTGISSTTGGNIIGLSTFTLLSNGETVFIKSFNPKTDVSGQEISINDHEFNTGERLIYSGVGNTSIGIVTTSVPGIGNTNILPADIFPIKVTKDKIKVAISTSNAAAGTAVTFTNLNGVGTNHTLEVHTDVATNRSFITIDNVIQSPIARKILPLTLSSQVAISTTRVLLHDVSNIKGKDLIKINDEIMKVDLVAIGATNSLDVIRGAMGTVAAAHTVGAAVTAVSGDYRIEKGLIHFSDAPYGPSGIGTLTTNSSFSGRAFFRLNYDNNYILDDISESFNGIGRTFNLTSNGNTVTGIQGINTSFGAVLINNIFQKPFYNDVGSIVRSDYRITGVGQTIVFTGAFDNDGDPVAADNTKTPRGGRIDQFTVGVGSGFQTPYAATATVTVSAAGTISAVGIVTGGTGYLEVPRVSIASSFGSNAEITASVTSGIVTALTISNPGTGYTATDANLKVIIDSPRPYVDLPLSGGSGSGAAMDIVVGTGGSIITFDMSKRGIGYEIGDILTLDQLQYNSGVSTLPFTVTVDSKFQDKFSGWTFGQLLELDDFSNFFNGFRKTFLFTRTTDSGREFYSIVARDGSGVILPNNLFIFINDVLQRPNVDYSFTGGTRLEFLEAPKAGSSCRVYFYTGSDNDFVQIDVDQTIKPGDTLQLQRSGNTAGQDPRVVYQLIAADTVETQVYTGVGIVTDSTVTRPIDWKKQTEDVIIDGVKIDKCRNYLQSQFFPSTNIIQPVSATDTKIYVENTYPIFQKIDDQGQTRNNIRIVSSEIPTTGLATAIVAANGTISGITINDGGSGYKSIPQVSIQEPPIPFPQTSHQLGVGSTTVFANKDQNDNQTQTGTGVTAKATASITSGIITSITITNAGSQYDPANPPLVIIEPQEADDEDIENVTFNGDYGGIVGIAVSNTGFNMASKKCIIFDLKPDPNIIEDTGKGRSGITTGDFFVIKNTFVGTGVTSVGATAGTNVAIGTAFIDNVFYAHHYVSIGSSILRVFSNVNSVAGINTSAVSHLTKLGNYSWGSIEVSRTPNSHAFTFFNQQGTAGISSSAHVSRLIKLKTEY